MNRYLGVVQGHQGYDDVGGEAMQGLVATDDDSYGLLIANEVYHLHSESREKIYAQ